MVHQFIRLLAILISFCFMMTACSDPNPDAPSENDVHSADWPISHSLETDLQSCTLCHGSNYQGSGDAVSCYSCHYDGPPFGLHPSSWLDVYVDHRAFVTVNGFTTCATTACHGVDPFVQGGLTAPSCGSADFTNENGVTHSCHSGHISGASWLLPNAHVASAIADSAGCFVCHDLNISNPTYPACRDCHTVSVPNYALDTCSSCHNRPPLTGEHDKHVNGEGYGCSVCHFGYGTNSLGHWYPDPTVPADVIFDTVITGTAISYDGTNCNGDCHNQDHNDSW